MGIRPWFESFPWKGVPARLDEVRLIRERAALFFAAIAPDRPAERECSSVQSEVSYFRAFHRGALRIRAITKNFGLKSTILRVEVQP